MFIWQKTDSSSGLRVVWLAEAVITDQSSGGGGANCMFHDACDEKKSGPHDDQDRIGHDRMF